MQVHQLRAAEKQTLQTLEAGIAGVALLEEGKEQQMAEQIEQLQPKIEQGNRALKTQQSLISWRQELIKVERAEQDVRNKQLQTEQLWQAFQPDYQQLRRAEQAAPINLPYQTLQASLKRQTELVTQLSQLDQQIPTLTAQLSVEEER